MSEATERRAKELAELSHRLNGNNLCETCGHWRNDHAMDLVGEHFCEHDECKCEEYVGVMPPSYAELVFTLRGEAAALAACARETLQQAEKACEALYAQPISCAEVGMCIEAIRTLERAAGESSLDPQGI